MPSQSSRNVRPIAWSLVILLAVSTPPDARGGDFRGEMDQFAGRIKQLLDGEHESAIALNQFTSPPRLAAKSASGILKALEEGLVKRGVQVKKNARLEVNGEYRQVEDPVRKKTVVRIL